MQKFEGIGHYVERDLEDIIIDALRRYRNADPKDMMRACEYADALENDTYLVETVTPPDEALQIDDGFDQEAWAEWFPQSDWSYDVSNGDTKLGYGDWLLHQAEAMGLDTAQEIFNGNPTEAGAKMLAFVADQYARDEMISVEEAESIKSAAAAQLDDKTN